MLARPKRWLKSKIISTLLRLNWFTVHLFISISYLLLVNIGIFIWGLILVDLRKAQVVDQVIFSRRFYPGVPDALKFASSNIYIVTTKQVRPLINSYRALESTLERLWRSKIIKNFCQLCCMFLHALEKFSSNRIVFSHLSVTFPLTFSYFRADLRMLYCGNLQGWQYHLKEYMVLELGQYVLKEY